MPATTLTNIPKKVTGTHVRKDNPINGPYKLFHQSINADKKFKIIEQQRSELSESSESSEPYGFVNRFKNKFSEPSDPSGFVNRFKNKFPSASYSEKTTLASKL